MAEETKNPTAEEIKAAENTNDAATLTAAADDEKGKLAKVLKDVYEFFKKILEIQVKFIPTGNGGVKVEIYIWQKLITKRPVTQTEANEILRDIKKGNWTALKNNPNVKTSRAFAISKRIKDIEEPEEKTA